MKIKLQTTAIFFLILSLFIFACSPASPAPVIPADNDLPAAATSTPVPAATFTPTLTSTVAPTATVYPPVFDSEVIGDHRVLDSFILTRTDTITGGGGVMEDQETIGYIKEPFSVYELGKYLFPTGGKEEDKYLIDGRLYEGFSNGSWYFTQEASPDEIDSLQRASDMRFIKGGNMGPVSAQFVGQEDFEGIPANHFTFDQTNLREGSDPTGTYKIEEAQGDFYLSQDGNYVLYFHVKLTGNVYPISGEPGYSAGEREITEELSSINQLTDIAVPADFDLELDFGLPLPEGSIFQGITSYRDGFLPDYYFYLMPVSTDEFFEFYKNMPPTNGFTFSRIGRVTNHPACADFLDQDCVILTKGSAEFILFYKGDISGANPLFITAERDR